MRRQHLLGRITTASLVLCWLTVPVAADGLSRFEQAMKEAPHGLLTYKEGKALGDNGFVIEGVVVTPPPDATGGTKAQPIPIRRIAVEDFDFSAIDKNAPPNFAKIRTEGVEIGSAPAEGVDLKAMTGLDKITADFQIDYRIDPDRKTMTLNRLELDLNGLARLEFSMVLDGIEPDSPDNTTQNATLRTASLVFEDRMLLGKTLPAAAKAQGGDADAFVKMAREMLDALRTGQGPTTLAVLDALASYIEDYKQPKGALRVTVNPPNKMTMATINDLKNPDEAIKSLGLVVSYPGTRSGGSAQPAVSSGPDAAKGGGSK